MYQRMANSNIKIETNECLNCRLITGFGVIAIGAYIFAQSKKHKPVERNVMKLIASGTFCLGTARLLDLDVLKANKKES